MKIDLIYSGNSLYTPKWQLGKVICFESDVFLLKNSLAGYLLTTESEYFIYVNSEYFEIPSEENILKIVTNFPGEIWHAGLKCNYAGLPKILDYIEPNWIYSLDAPASVASSSWKISIDCFLAKTAILKKCKLFEPIFETKTGCSIDWGYSLYKKGVILRYEPTLTHFLGGSNYQEISKSDELRFVLRNFSRKWYYWSLYRLVRNSYGIKKTLLSFYKTYSTKPNELIYVQRQISIPTVANNSFKISVFTPTLQRYSYLEEELKQLREQTIKPFEIFITDQTDKSLREISWLANYEDLPIVYQGQDEKGQCNAWNFCLENAKGEYVLFLGDDADEIQPNFIESLLNTLIYYKADMVACNIKERENDYPFKQSDVFTTDTFPICLVKRSVFKKTGGYDYAYNKGIRADGDLAIRMHLAGSLMLLNPEIKIHHHRAPIGGLRAHGQRTVTRSMSKKNTSTFHLPSFSEIYLGKRYFSLDQEKESNAIRTLSMLSIDGGLLKKISKVVIFIFKSKIIRKELLEIESKAINLFNEYPQIPKIKN